VFVLLCVSSLEDWESIRLKNQGSGEKFYNMSQKWGNTTTHHKSSPVANQSIKRSKTQRSRSQGHKVQKGDRVNDVSYALTLSSAQLSIFFIFGR